MMYKICVFAGTTEGRELVDFLCSQEKFRVFACVATEYGQTLLEERKNLTISAARLTEQEMAALFLREEFDLVVDATHPYASAVTENIAAACANTGAEYLRLLRLGSALPEDCIFVEDIPATVDYLNGTDGRILLTTGSKELKRYTSLTDFENRVYARVLPMEESLHLCAEAGMKQDHIIAMQGPFSCQMNAATLQMTGAKFLVTKDTGKPGGFDEKIAAAKMAGAKLVVIGRPPQKEGLSYSQIVAHLCSRFGLHQRPRVSVVGMGPGAAESQTRAVHAVLAEARCIIGAKRMVESTAHPGQRQCIAIVPEEIAGFIAANPQDSPFAVVMSGDIGFFSGAKKLLPLLSGCDVQLLPGLSSLVYLCARLGCGYEDVVCVSAHGRDGSILPQVRRHRRVFSLVGGENGAAKLCAQLVEAGFSDANISIGERLSYPEEKFTVGSAEALAQLHFDSLSAMLIEHDHSTTLPCGLPEEAFLREKSVPMTKSEVRAVCLSKLALPEDAVVWDIGAGTGSVSIEMALQAAGGQVYAVEQKPEAVALLEKNCRRFGVENVTVVPGSAPECCAHLPSPTHAFIGGSSGNLEEILTLLVEKNPAVRIVATAISLETVAELTAQMKKFKHSVAISLSVARSKTLGAYNLMSGQNPIYIFTLEGNPESL